MSGSSVLDAANSLVAAFSRHDRDAYFAAFAPTATFIFYNLDRTLKSRAAYETEWDLWEKRDGFHVVKCTSTEQHIQLHGNVAVFTHSVETEVRIGADFATNFERETIVFEKTLAGNWLAVHEHLSAHLR
jgi:ketosteroid isomerase-like protein